jgi:hypothetical protein
VTPRSYTITRGTIASSPSLRRQANAKALLTRKSDAMQAAESPPRPPALTEEHLLAAKFPTNPPPILSGAARTEAHNRYYSPFCGAMLFVMAIAIAFRRPRSSYVKALYENSLGL